LTVERYCTSPSISRIRAMIAITSLCTSRPAIVAAGEFNGDHTGDRVRQISEVDIDVIGSGLG